MANLKKAVSTVKSINSKKTQLSKLVNDPSEYYADLNLDEDLDKRAGWFDQTSLSHCDGLKTEVNTFDKSKELYIETELAAIRRRFKNAIPFFTEKEKKAFEGALEKMPGIIERKINGNYKRYLKVFAPKVKGDVISEEELQEAVAE